MTKGIAEVTLRLEFSMGDLHKVTTRQRLERHVREQLGESFFDRGDSVKLTSCKVDVIKEVDRFPSSRPKQGG